MEWVTPWFSLSGALIVLGLVMTALPKRHIWLCSLGLMLVAVVSVGLWLDWVHWLCVELPLQLARIARSNVEQAPSHLAEAAGQAAEGARQRAAEFWNNLNIPLLPQAPLHSAPPMPHSVAPVAPPLDVVTPSLRLSFMAWAVFATQTQIFFFAKFPIWLRQVFNAAKRDA